MTVILTEADRMSHSSQTLFGLDGQPVGVFDPAAEWERLKVENEALRAEAVAVRREQDEREECLTALETLLPDWTPTPATAEQWAEAIRVGDNSHLLGAIIARMAAGGSDGGR